MGWMFAPIAWLIGIPWAESTQGGALLGTKLVLNELVAYIQLAAVPVTDLSAHSRMILTYALCGFANFGSLGIMLGGVGALVPERRSRTVPARAEDVDLRDDRQLHYRRDRRPRLLTRRVETYAPHR